MKGLLITADDFGMTPGVCSGIVEAIRHGAVAATTAMVCYDDAAANITAASSELSGRIGLHLQLTDGIPRCDPATIPTLVNDQGRFPRKPNLIQRIDRTEVQREWQAQLNALRALGIEPSHLDSHHHAHRNPVALEVYWRMAKALGVPARGAASVFPGTTTLLRKRGVRCADVFIGSWADAEPTLDRLLTCVAEASQECPPGGIAELMCHPGYADDALRARSTSVAERENELRVLCSPELPGRLRELGFELVPVSALASRRVT